MYSANWWRIFSLVTVACAALLVWLVSSPHRVRLIAGSYVLIDSAANVPAIAPFQFLPVDREILNGFRESISNLHQFDSMAQPRREDPMPAIDDPDTSLALLQRGK